MTEAQFQMAVEYLRNTARDIEQAKRPGYTQANEDVLFNFKFVADQMGVTPMQVWGVYFLKHVMALSAYAKNAEIPQAEGIIGRFADAINYLYLGFALAKEATEEGTTHVVRN